MALLFVAGVCLVTAFSTLNSLVQENAPAGLKGRVLASTASPSAAGMPLGSLVAGLLVRYLGVPVVVWARFTRCWRARGRSAAQRHHACSSAGPGGPP